MPPPKQGRACLSFQWHALLHVRFRMLEAAPHWAGRPASLSDAMHELTVAQNILEIVRQSVPREQEKSVRGIRVRIGELSGIVADSLDFCFSAIVNDTDMQKARLAIEQVPTLSRCKTCAHRFGIENWIFICPACRSTNLELISGKELEIVDIELADEGDEAI